MDWKQFFCFLVLFGSCSFVEGYVELDSYDLDLEGRSLTLYFTLSVQKDTLDLRDLRIVKLNDEEIATAQFTPSGAESVQLVNETTLTVTLSESDVSDLVSIPELCLNEESCYLAYRSNLIRDTNGGPTFPGVKKVSQFTPYPLYFESFELDLNRGLLTLGFNKNVSVNSMDVTALTFLSVGTAPVADGHRVLRAECLHFLGCVDGPTVVVELSQNDRDIISSNRVLCTGAQNCYITFNSSLIKDFGGYPVKLSDPPVLLVNDFTADANMPHLLAFGLDFSNMSLYLHFSEAVDPDTFNLEPNQLFLHNPKAYDFIHDVYSAGENAVISAQNYSTVIVISADTAVNVFTLRVYREDIYSAYLELNGGIIADYAGNRVQNTHGVPVYLDIGSAALTFTVDYRFVYDVGSESLRISFPCAAPENYLGEEFTVFNNNPTIANETYNMVTEYCGGYSNDLVCYLTDDLAKAFVFNGTIGDTKDDLWALVRSFCDEGGTLLVPADEVDPDTTPATLVAFTMDMNEGRIQLTFDNLLTSEVDVTQVKLQREEADDTHSLTLSSDSRYEVNGWQVNIYFTDADLTRMNQLAVAQTISSSYMCIGTGTASDLYGNNAGEVPCNGALQAERYIRAAPPVPTVLEAFSFNCETGRLDLSFSQHVNTKTLDLTQAVLLNERGDEYRLWKGDFDIGYLSTVQVNLSAADISTIRGMNGFLVNSDYIYLSIVESLAYDVNDLLLNVTVDQLAVSNPVPCSCHIGYRLTQDRADCEDIDECSEAGTDPNIQSCGHTCTNTNGSYFCTCDNGYRLQEDQHTCNDIDECEEGTYNCSQLCVNDPGSYHCECNMTEYVLLSDRRSCESIDHCKALDHGCNQYCVDDFGTYRCVCKKGYRLGSDEHTCEDIDECAEETSNCSQVCVNTVPGYYCECDPGYLLNGDGATCDDIDECSDNNGGCQQNCTNLIGSHECSCELGYTLQQDKRRCVADPCNTTLMDPEYGSVSCDGAPVTDTSCTFTCQPGFYVVGSRVRTCQGDHTWSGVNVMCDRLRCEELTAFHDAAVKQPCDNSYESSCTIECLPAYFNPYPDMTTMECVLTSEANNTVEWTQRPYCQEREPCLPTPCKHNAPCTEIEVETGRLPVCDCSGTGYIGDYCDIGVISVPNLPILVVGITLPITISAFPDDDLRVDLITDLDVSPKTLNFTRSVTEVEVTIYPTVSELFTLDFEISGTNAHIFRRPSPLNIVVYSGGDPLDIDDIIPPSCCSNESASVHICPSGTEVIFTSTCHHQVESWPINSRVLQGVSFVKTGDLDLPLSIRSVNMEPSGDFGLSYGFSPYTGAEECVSCASNSTSPCQESQWNCTCFSPSADITATYLFEESLAKTFLTNMEDLLPSWIKVEAVETGRRYHNDFSYNIKLLDALELLSMEECRGFYQTKLKDLGTYAVLVYQGDIRVAIGNDTLTHHPTGGDPFCVAINLCDGEESSVLISLPRGFPYHNLTVYSSLSSSNWIVEDIYGLILNIREELETVSKQPDIAIYGKVSFTGSLDVNTVKLSFEGLIGLEAESVSEPLSPEVVPEFSGFMTGRTYLTLNASRELVQLQGIAATSTVKYNGSDVMEDPCSSPRSLKVTLSQWTVTDQNNIFNSLLSDGGQFNCPVDVEMKMGADGQLYDIIFTTSCHHLTLGNFAVEGMYHKLYLLHSASEIHSCEGIGLPHHQQQHLALVSELKEGGNIPFSWFLDFNGEKNQSAILTMIDPLNKTFTSHTIDEVAVLKLFGDPVPVQLLISNEDIQFELEMEVLNTKSQVSAIATAHEPNAPPVLRIHGNLERGAVWNDLEDTTSELLYKELEKAPKLLATSQSSLGAAYDLLRHLEGLKNTSMGRKEEADNLYLLAKSARQRAEVEYEGHSVLVVLDGRRWQSTELVSTLNQLCTMVDDCIPDPYSAIVCGSCNNMAVPYTKQWYGEEECSRKINKPVTRREHIVKPRLTPVEGPVVGVLSCDQSQERFWEDPSFGCSVIKTTEGLRTIFVKSNKSEEFVEYVTEETSYACNAPVMEDTNWQMDHYCCGLEIDTMIHNTECLGWNIGCRLGRELVIDALRDSTPSDATTLYSTLDNLLKERILSEVEESIAFEDLRSAEKTLGQSSYFHLQSGDLVTLREARHKAIWERYLQNDNDTEYSVVIDGISFNLTLEAKPPTTIPLEVMYSVNNCSNNSLTFDFLVSSVQSSIIAGANQLAKRAVEGTCPHSSSSATDYGTYCKSLQDVASVFNVLLGSLKQGIEHYANASNDAEWLRDDLKGKLLTIESWTVPNAWRVSDVEELVNISAVDEVIGNTTEYETFRNLVDNMASSAWEHVRVADRYVFIKWLLYVDQHIGTLMSEYNCSGMVECLAELSELVEGLLLVANTDWSRNLLSQLEEATDDMLSIVSDESVRSMATLLGKCAKMERIVKEMMERDYWCEMTPEVYAQMSRESPLVDQSGNLTMNCSTTSRYPGHYQWLKDDLALPGETSDVLFIPRVTLDTAGDYTCSVQTHKGEEVSTTLQLVVHQSPRLTLLATNVTVYQEEGTVFLRCNATGTPSPSWKWYFKSPSSSDAEELEGETRSEVVVNPPGENREGWYYCEASNVVGTSRASPGAYLRVLESKVSNIGVISDLELSTNPRRKRALESEGFLKDIVAVSPDEKNSDLSFNLTQLLIHSLFSNTSTVTVEEGRVIVEDITNNIKLTFLVVSGSMEKSNDQTMEETLHQITLSRMEWDMVVDTVSTYIGNETVYDYSLVGIDYVNISSASVNRESLINRCPQGFELKRDSNLFCVSCPPGSYQTYSVEYLSSSVSLTYPTCQLCPLGHYQPNPEQDRCLQCPPGHHYSSLGGTECTPCIPGTHQPQLGQVECSLCPPGHHQTQDGQPTCEPCPKGHNQTAVGQIFCKICPNDHYQDEEGQLVCKPCPSDHVYNSIIFGGATDVTNCTCVVNCDPVDTSWVIWMPIVVALVIGLCLVVLIAIILKCVRTKKVKQAGVRDAWKYESQIELSMSSVYMRRNEGAFDFDGSGERWTDIIGHSRYIRSNPLFHVEDTEMDEMNPIVGFKQGKDGKWTFGEIDYQETEFGFHPKPLSEWEGPDGYDDEDTDEDSASKHGEKDTSLQQEEDADAHWSKVTKLIKKWEKTVAESGTGLYKNHPKIEKPPDPYENGAYSSDSDATDEDYSDEDSYSEDSDVTHEDSEGGSVDSGTDDDSDGSEGSDVTNDENSEGQTDHDSDGSKDETDKEESDELEEFKEALEDHQWNDTVQLLKVEPTQSVPPPAVTTGFVESESTPTNNLLHIAGAEVITNPGSVLDDVIDQMMMNSYQFEDKAPTSPNTFDLPPETASLPKVKKSSLPLLAGKLSTPVKRKTSSPGGLGSLISKWEQMASPLLNEDEEDEECLV